MNISLLSQLMKKNDDTYFTLAQKLSISVNTLLKKCNGVKAVFKLCEMTKIKEIYSLTAEQTIALFFSNAVED